MPDGLFPHARDTFLERNRLISRWQIYGTDDTSTAFGGLHPVIPQFPSQSLSLDCGIVFALHTENVFTILEKLLEQATFQQFVNLESLTKFTYKYEHLEYKKI